MLQVLEPHRELCVGTYFGLHTPDSLDAVITRTHVRDRTAPGPDENGNACLTQQNTDAKSVAA